MRNLTPGTYADLRTGLRKQVAANRCGLCARGGFVSAEHVAAHNERCATTGERVYPQPQYRRAA